MCAWTLHILVQSLCSKMSFESVSVFLLHEFVNQCQREEIPALFYMKFAPPKNSQWCDECQCVDSAERCIGSPPRPPLPHPFFFHPPPFFRNMHSPSWHPSQENTIFYHDTLESGRLKTINIKPWKPITCRNCVSWYI